MKRPVIMLLAIAATALLSGGRVQAAEKPWTLQYSYTTVFYGSTSFELRYQPGRWGWRLWSDHGYDEDHCKSLGWCYHDTYWGLDVLREVRPRTYLLVGYQSLYRDIGPEDGVPFWHAMTHEGIRIGVITSKPLSPKLDATFELVYVPFDVLYGVSDAGEGSKSVNSGAMYKVGLSYELGDDYFASVAWQSWGFNTRPGQRDFYGHIWLGYRFSVGRRF